MSAVSPIAHAPHQLKGIESDPTRVGVILLATDLTFERDAARLIDQNQAVMHVTRIAFDNPTTPEQLRLMGPQLTECAARLVPGAELSAVAFACTAASATIGNEAVGAAIAVALNGVPVVTPTSAAVAGLAALRARRVAVLTPYLEETTEPLLAGFSRDGLEIVRAACFGLEDDRDMARISDDSIIEAACEMDDRDVEAVFLSCTAMPGVDVIDRIEARLDKPVVTSNQALCWALARLAGLNRRPNGFGRLFDCALPPDLAKKVTP